MPKITKIDSSCFMLWKKTEATFLRHTVYRV